MSAPARQEKPRQEKPAWNFFNVAKERLKLGAADRQGRSRVSGVPQYQLIDLIATLTYGDPRWAKARTVGKTAAAAPEWVALTNVQITRQIGCSEKTLIEIRADGDKRGILQVADTAELKKRGMLGPKGPLSLKGVHPQAKWYRICPENWNTAPRYEPPAPKLLVMPEPEPEEDDAPEPEVVKVAADQPLLLMPGQKSRPIPWKSEAKKFAFDCTRVSVGLKIEPTLSFGVVRFLISQEVTGGTPEASFRGSTFSPKVPSEAGSAGEPPAMVRQNLLEGLTRRGYTFGPEATDRLLSALRGATPEHFFSLLDPELAAAERKRKPYPESHVFQKAKDAADSWPAVQQGERKQRERRARAQAEHDRITAGQILRSDDPMWTEADREWARRLISGEVE